MAFEDDTVYSDDLLPLDGGILNLEEPEAQTTERQVERADIMAAAPILDGLLNWFDEEIT